MITNKALVQAMRTILTRPNIYINEYPFNCLFYDGHFISGDCWNTIKAILWDSDIVDNYTYGKFSYAPNDVIGDWDGETILAHCTEQGTDISKAPVGAFLLYEDGSHAGIYLGGMQAIEMTTGWNAHRMVISDIGPNGERKSNGVQIGRWRAWGKLPGVEYIVDPEPVKYDYHKGDSVKVKKDAKVYGEKYRFISEFYDAVHTVFEEPTSDRIVLINEKYGLNPVHIDDLIKFEKAVLKVGDKVKIKGSRDVYGTWLAKAWLNLRKLEVQGFWGDGSVVVGQIGKSYAECVMHPEDVERI